MTACASAKLSPTFDQGVAPPPTAGRGHGGGTRAGCTITVDGAYAARLAGGGDSLYPERWTLDGPEPYAVPLPGSRPEEPGTEVQPMGDGRVLIRRPVAGLHVFSLLYPTGPGTGELPLGTVECPDGTCLRLLPPVPGGGRAYALAVGVRSTAVWRVAGGGFGPQLLAEVPGRCSGGAWLDRQGRMLALDRETGGRTKAVVVDLERGGEVSPLLQIAADSDDRLLLADPDSGLLLVGSDAASPGQERLGWGVLGSTLPVRFPECLRLPDCVVTPFAIQPGQMLTPEQCGVALRIDGALGSWVGVWRPAERQVCHLAAPEGWLAGSGLWTADGVLRLPYATASVPCGVAHWEAPLPGAAREARGARVAVPAGARWAPQGPDGTADAPLWAPAGAKPASGGTRRALGGPDGTADGPRRVPDEAADAPRRVPDQANAAPGEGHRAPDEPDGAADAPRRVPDRPMGAAAPPRRVPDQVDAASGEARRVRSGPAAAARGPRWVREGAGAVLEGARWVEVRRTARPGDGSWPGAERNVPGGGSGSAGSGLNLFLDGARSGASRVTLVPRPSGVPMLPPGPGVPSSPPADGAYDMPEPASAAPGAPRPVPLQQAPLTGRTAGR